MALDWQGKPGCKVSLEINQPQQASGVLVLLADLKTCSRTRNLVRGKQIHAEAVECGFVSSIYVANTLINMYAKCGSMVDAHKVFDSLKHPTVVSWTALILGYACNGEGGTAMYLFTRMHDDGPEPDSVTFVAALKACTSAGASGWVECRHKGKAMHNLAAENGCNSDIFVKSTLLDLYAKCGSMVDAREVFDSMQRPDTLSWTVLISGYADNGQVRTALELFAKIEVDGCQPDSVTFVAAVKACTSLAVKEDSDRAECRDRGKALHNLAAEDSRNVDVYVENTLINMYGKCRSMVDAREIFESMKGKDVVSWNALISGYVASGQVQTAQEMFARMKDEGPAPDSVTFVAALNTVCSLATNGEAGVKALHNLAVGNGSSSDIYFQSTLVNMYVKFCSIEDARAVFDSVKHADVISWTALILGYANNGEGHPALDLFTRMRTEGPAPDYVTLMAALKACGLVGALEFGRTIHSEIDSGIDLDVVLVTCLVDFYAKCGSLVESQRIFNLHPETRDVITWNALLAGFSSCGDKEAVFQLFETMQDAGFQPDGITFLGILTCCTHAGLVKKGKEYFDAMSTKYRIIPNIKHYTCMVDLYGRANKLDDAIALLEGMPCRANDVTWMTILGACRKWKNVEIGRLALECLNGEVGDMSRNRFVLEEHEILLGLTKQLQSGKKLEETCWTNEVGEVHTFFSAEGSQHPQIHEIRDKWKSMSMVMKQHGLDMDTEETLCGHSERLAVTCALISTQPAKTIRIVKNMKICDACHTATALISKLESRSIICRDANRIHVFEDGKCSCLEI